MSQVIRLTEHCSTCGDKDHGRTICPRTVDGRDRVWQILASGGFRDPDADFSPEEAQTLFEWLDGDPAVRNQLATSMYNTGRYASWHEAVGAARISTLSGDAA